MDTWRRNAINDKAREKYLGKVQDDTFDRWKRADPVQRDKWGRQTAEGRDSEVNDSGWYREGMQECCEVFAVWKWETEGVPLPFLSLRDSICWLRRSSLTGSASITSLSRAGQPQAELQAFHTAQLYSWYWSEVSAVRFVVVAIHPEVSQPCHTGSASDDWAAGFGPCQDCKSCKPSHCKPSHWSSE